MAFIDSLAAIFTKGATPPAVPSPTDTKELSKLFAFLKNQVSQTNLIAAELAKFDALKSLPPEKMEIAAIPVYFALEEIIVKNPPPATKKSFTKETLRQETARAVDISALEEPFRLVFAPPDKQRLRLYIIGLKNMADFLIRHISIPRIDKIVGEITKDTFLEGVTVNKKGVDFHPEILEYRTVPVQHLINIFHNLYASFYKEIHQSYGEKQALELISEAYSFVTSNYDYGIVKEFLDILPEGLFEREKNAFLTREELEKKAATVVAEKKQKEFAEKREKELAEKVSELNQTKAATLNLLQDALRLEEELKTERDRARAIINAMGDGLVVLDKNFRVVMINPVAETLLDTTDAEAIGANWGDLIQVFKDERELTGSDRPVGVCMTTGEKVNVSLDDDIYYKTKSGKKYPVSIICAPLTGKGITGAVIVFNDVTADKESKNIIEATVKERTRQLREEQARLEASINSINVGFIMVDINCNIITINSAAKRILYRPTNGKFLKDTAVWVRFEFTIDYIQEQLKGSFNLKEQILVKCLQERKTVDFSNIYYKNLFLRIFLTPIVILKDKIDVIGAVIVIEDVTETKVLERSKDEFFSIASHELRTPLTAIRGNTSLIKQYFMDSIKDKELKAMINDIHESSIRLIDIVNDFLDLSRLEQKRIEFKFEKFDIGKVLDEVVQEFSGTAAEKKLKLNLEKPEGPIPEVFADRNRVKQVLLNLVGNGLKFTQKGGVDITVKPGGGCLKVAVHDTGRGIPPGNQHLLFRKFQQAGDSLITRDTTRGTGLGLYISKLLMEDMEGNIELDHSIVGKGTTFVITIPTQESQNLKQLAETGSVETKTQVIEKELPIENEAQMSATT